MVNISDLKFKCKVEGDLVEIGLFYAPKETTYYAQFLLSEAKNVLPAFMELALNGLLQKVQDLEKVNLA